MGHFVKKARDRFEMGKEPKMNMYHFGEFPDFRASHMLHRPSPAKYILQMLFGAFQGTPRTFFLLK